MEKSRRASERAVEDIRLETKLGVTTSWLPERHGNPRAARGTRAAV